jgi:hypothetical protein
VRCVIVNGRLVLKDGTMTGLLPGGPVYGPGLHHVSETAAAAVAPPAAAQAAR